MRIKRKHGAPEAFTWDGSAESAYALARWIVAKSGVNGDGVPAEGIESIGFGNPLGNAPGGLPTLTLKTEHEEFTFEAGDCLVAEVDQEYPDDIRFEAFNADEFAAAFEVEGEV